MWISEDTMDEVEDYMIIHHTSPLPNKYLTRVSQMVMKDHLSVIAKHPELDDYATVEESGEYQITLE